MKVTSFDYSVNLARERGVQSNMLYLFIDMKIFLNEQVGELKREQQVVVTINKDPERPFQIYQDHAAEVRRGRVN